MLPHYGRASDRRGEYGPQLGEILSLVSPDLRPREGDVELLERAVSTIHDSETENLVLACALRAGIQIRLAEFMMATYDFDICINLLTSALPNAAQANDEWLIHRSLRLLGEAHGRLGDWESSIAYFQQSLGYCRLYWPAHLLDCLSGIADALVSSGTRWYEARLVYQQLLSITPTNLSYRVRYFQCLLQIGDTDAVRSAYRQVESDSMETIANAVAARAASRQYARASAFARACVEAARSNGDSDWVHFFEQAEGLSRTQWKMHFLFHHDPYFECP